MTKPLETDVPVNNDASTVENFGAGALGGAALGAVGVAALLNGALIPAFLGSVIGGVVGGAVAAQIGKLTDQSELSGPRK